MAIVVTSTNGHRSRVCELNGNGRDTEALCRHLFSLAKAALKSVACFVVVYISSAAIWMGRGTSTYQHQKADRRKNSNLIVCVRAAPPFLSCQKQALSRVSTKVELPGRNSTGPTHSLYVTRERVPSVKQGGQAKSTELRSIEASGILG